MAKQIDRKVWITVVDLLRFATPIMCVVITCLSSWGVYVINQYESHIKTQDEASAEHTTQLNNINMKLAVLIEGKEYEKAEADKFSQHLDSLDNKVINLQVEFAKLERQK